MQRHFSTEGIILKKKPYNENDEFITLYSPLLGKIQAVAKASRRLTSSFNGHLETLNIGKFQLYQSPHRFTITQCHVLKTWPRIRENFHRSVLALAMMEIFEKSIHGQEPGAELFEFIKKTLEDLSHLPNTLLILETFKLKLLQFLGLLPTISSCSHCLKRWNGVDEIWLQNDGQLSCGSCQQAQPQPPRGQKINFEIIKLMAFLTSSTASKRTITMSKTQWQEFKKISNSLMTNHLHGEIHSERIMATLENY